MRKKALLALLLAMTLLLSGCALIVKDQAVDDAQVIIKMGDKTITKAQVNEEVQNQIYSMSSYYASFGQSFDPSDPEVIAMAKESAVSALKQDLVLTEKAKELGLDQLTAEEEEEAAKSAQESMDGAMDYAKSYLVDPGLEGEELENAAKKALEELGATYDTYLESAKRTIVDNKLRSYAIKDVTVSDEEIEAELASRIESDKNLYGEKPASYAMAVNNGTVVYYVPAGVRRVKQILIKFKEEDQTAISEANQALTDAGSQVSAAQAKVDAANQTLEAIPAEENEENNKARTDTQAELDAAQKELDEAKAAQETAQKTVDEATAKAYENIDADADAVLTELDGGADWQTLMDEKNEDPGMKNNEKGYAVATGMTNFDSAFVEAAMGLEKIGDHTGKVKGAYGYYIIRYDSDEPEGPVALEAVKEQLSSSLLSTKQTQVYNDTVNQWVEEAGITVDMNALNN